MSVDDRRLIQIVDAVMAEAVRKGGAWIACRPGCTQCCIGVFPISESDAARLRSGLDDLRRRELDCVAVLPDADETRMRRYQHEIVAAVGKVALRA